MKNWRSAFTSKSRQAKIRDNRCCRSSCHVNPELSHSQPQYENQLTRNASFICKVTFLNLASRFRAVFCFIIVVVNRINIMASFLNRSLELPR